MSEYEILLIDKIKSRRICKLFTVIEAFQSYDGEWEIILMPKEVAEGDVKEAFLDKASPIPTTHGAILFPDLIVDEKALSRLAELPPGEVKIIEMGSRPIWLIIREKKLREILVAYPEVLKEVSFEIFLPLKTSLPENVDPRDYIPYVDRVEKFKTEVQLLDPKVVKNILNKANYVGEYLEALENAFRENSIEEKLSVLALRGICPANISLKELEKKIKEYVEAAKCFREGTMMFTRIYIQEQWE
ncbi:MAG: hypothetical protein DRJ52_04690 [Thermoprotei archaeon]|nr:MAG: hypothetical protein DRJ52_04690 [Thermoprotei archaeon]RLE99980.1 MAG: hypothetical protein DRJ63_03675 [Thermoprotei archaeon]